jgi:orotate phosphoribosyltransferase
MDLFVGGNFTLHSGAKSKFKIDCDALTDAEILTLAALIVERVRPFKEVYGVPRGGLRIAEALRRYADPAWDWVLVVDDVLTTGKSMEEVASKMMDAGEKVQGAVIFSRTRSVPVYIMPLFILAEIR